MRHPHRSRLVQAGKKQQTAADNYADAYQGARDAGWTIADLTTLGLEPGKATRKPHDVEPAPDAGDEPSELPQPTVADTAAPAPAWASAIA